MRRPFPAAEIKAGADQNGADALVGSKAANQRAEWCRLVPKKYQKTKKKKDIIQRKYNEIQTLLIRKE